MSILEVYTISAVDSVTTGDGALVVVGGVGIGKKLNVGGDTKIEGTTQSTTKDTGAFIINGGAGIEKSLNVGTGCSIEGAGISTFTAAAGIATLNITGGGGGGGLNVLSFFFG